MSGTVVQRREYRKAASGGGQRLAHEARLLTAIRHPGVVALLTDPGEQPEELLLGFLPGGDLHGRRFPPQEVAGIGAAVATTLADLHDLRVVYHGCSTDHILLGADGSPVLCGFGSAQYGLDDRDLLVAQRNDVHALIAVLVELLDEDGGQLRRQLQRAGRRRQASARSLARQLASVTGARLPHPETKATVARTPDTIELAPLVGGPLRQDQSAGKETTTAVRPAVRRRKFVFALTAVVLVVGGVVLVTRSGGPPANASVAAACPAVDDGCRPVVAPNGVLTTPAGRWSLGESGDVVVLGRWRCNSVALPALLAPATGQVWAFDQWSSPGTDVAAEPVVRIPGATSLDVVPGANGCDQLQAVGPGDRRTSVNARLAR